MGNASPLKSLIYLSSHFAITFIYCISKSFFPCFLFFILAANQKEAATVNMNCALKLTKFRQRIQHSFKPFIHLSIHRFITPSPPSPSIHGSQRDFYCAAAPLPVVLMRFQTLFFLRYWISKINIFTAWALIGKIEHEINPTAAPPAFSHIFRSFCY